MSGDTLKNTSVLDLEEFEGYLEDVAYSDEKALHLDSIDSSIRLWALYSSGVVESCLLHSSTEPPSLADFHVCEGQIAEPEIHKLPVDFSVGSESASPMTNRCRARAAALGLIMANKFCPNGDHHDGLIDLLCNLHHLADYLDIDFYQALDSASAHYVAEVAEVDGNIGLQ